MKTEHLELLKRLETYSPDDASSAFPFSERLARENGWPLVYAQRVIREYMRFAFLALAAGHPVTPSDEVDQAWHLHMLYTESYWKDFCGRILGKPLHHGPTKGGASESRKFHDWYSRTIESYQTFFAAPPPADIWPEASRRFGEAIHFIRVNRQRHWIIPKPAWIRHLTSLCDFVRAKSAGSWCFKAALIALILIAAGCGSIIPRDVALFDFKVLPCPPLFGQLTDGLWNLSPLDFDGPGFLRFFAALWAVCHGLAAWLRWSLRVPTDAHGAAHAEPDPYAIAYLSGKSELAVNAALANLCNTGAVKMDDKEPCVSGLNPLSQNAHPFEQAIHSFVTADGSVKMADVRESSKPLVAILEQRLITLGLLVSRGQAAAAVFLPLLVALIVPLIGICKITVGWSHGNPVGILILLCIVSIFVTWCLFARPVYRSRRGDRVLKELRRRHSKLEWTPTPASDVSKAGVLPLAIGLFGMGVLAGTELAHLEKSLRPPKGSSGCGGGCSVGGCGGGCGGCGGCGG